MKPPAEMVSLPCGCGAGLPVICPPVDIGQQIICPWSGTAMDVVVSPSAFGHREWETAARVDQLVACTTAFGIAVTVRRHRLAYCGLARNHFTRYQGRWLWEAVAAGERWADQGGPWFGIDDLRARLAGGTPGAPRNLQEWAWLAESCVAESPAFPPYAAMHSLGLILCDAYRELVPNPFLPLAWKPEWFTSSACDLAAHIYDARDFAAMPILADALQDAGCDDEQVLTHCRGSKPHARGCWVVDAILGKS